ncbi:MAG TPA: DUF362 domain-containing protein [Syntrophales bacterium]|nr:DUF362 domain-containing protein [Syntrophales bacterium]
MDRRSFIRKMIIAAAAVSCPAAFSPLAASRAEPSPAPDLAVVRGPSPERIVASAVDALGGMRRFVSPGDIVVVKPNMGWDRAPEFGANTHPAVVAALVGLAVEAGAKRVKVFDHTVNDPRRCYRQSGVAAAAEAAGAEVSFVDKRKFKSVRLDGEVLKEWPLYEDILEADKIINVPVAKTHGLSTLTLALKNWMGVMGGGRWRIHQRIHESLVDVARKVKPTLTVLDAVRILTANGPQGGRLEDVKVLDTVIAGTDQVAVDSYGATLFGLRGRDLGYVRIGHETGLGNMNLESLDIRKITL